MERLSSLDLWRIEEAAEREEGRSSKIRGEGEQSVVVAGILFTPMGGELAVAWWKKKYKLVLAHQSKRFAGSSDTMEDLRGNWGTCCPGYTCQTMASGPWKFDGFS